jgi:hypothetical protein
MKASLAPASRWPGVGFHLDYLICAFRECQLSFQSIQYVTTYPGLFYKILLRWIYGSCIFLVPTTSFMTRLAICSFFCQKCPGFCSFWIFFCVRDFFKLSQIFYEILFYIPHFFLKNFRYFSSFPSVTRPGQPILDPFSHLTSPKELMEWMCSLSIFQTYLDDRLLCKKIYKCLKETSHQTIKKVFHSICFKTTINSSEKGRLVRSN